MTVKELIEKLKLFPQDKEVSYESYCEMTDMSISDVVLDWDYHKKTNVVKIKE